MKQGKLELALIVGLVAAGLIACSNNATKSPDFSDNIQKSLNQQNLKDVSVHDDRDKGVVTLTGKVTTEDQKVQADSIAKSMAGGQVVANQIAVLPPDNNHEAKTAQSDLDTAIDKNVDAALIQNGIKKGVTHHVKNGVVTLDGNIASQAARKHAQDVAAAVPNVQQVVNELQVKNQKATATN